MSMINFGIDLGTTNSLISRFNLGTVEVFKNPKGFRESLPSVVFYRNDKIVVGEKAEQYAERDPKNVFRFFKRKMGTAEVFPIPSLGQSKSPVELSAEVLKELKTFIHTGEVPQAAVITIPASFDMRQANATKEAARAAGFHQVLLLQEPIAASIAYANSERGRDLEGSQWLVYDLGGGTFDVALVRIADGELTVVDHEGNNYFGGMDFDQRIVEQLIVPELERLGSFEDLIPEMHSSSGRYNTLWHKLLKLAEEAKIDLSHSTSTEIDFSIGNDIEDDVGDIIEGCLTITRTDFESVVRDAVDTSAQMIKELLTRNALRPKDLEFVLMVGGSTFIPYLRTRIGELLDISVNTGIDPTNAIVIGAAYYAGTKELELNATDREEEHAATSLKVRMAYERSTRESEELFAARIDGDVDGLFYRITRNDGGYDSGRKILTPRLQEDLPLQEDAFNCFTLRIYDSLNNLVPTEIPAIQIAHGKYAAGQMLPQDVCLILDDEKSRDKALSRVFQRNTVLPAHQKRTVEASVTLCHGSDEQIRIVFCEGSESHHPDTVAKIGELLIPARDLNQDIIKGTDIELHFELSESRTLSVTASVPSIGRTFEKIFKAGERCVANETLHDDLESLEGRIEKEKDEAIDRENYELADQLDSTLQTVWKLQEKAENIPDDSVTDERYQLDDEKRRIAQDVYKMTGNRRLEGLRDEYESARDDVKTIINENGTDSERQHFQRVLEQEPTFLNSNDPRKIKLRIEELDGIKFGVLRRTPEFLTDCFHYLCSRSPAFNDQTQSRLLLEAGRKAIADQNWEKLEEVDGRLFALLPQMDEDEERQQYWPRVGIR